MNKRNLKLITVATFVSAIGISGTHASLVFNTTVRDFQVAHPDFEDYNTGVVTGLVGAVLPPSKNPTYTGVGAGTVITSAATFAQWFDDVPGTNINIPVPLVLNETAPGSGIFEYLSGSFFPIDGQGWGNEALPHNYHFTLEGHTTFTYQAGQNFAFTGDDDVWVYINNQLVVDLGGVHGPASGGVSLDTLGLTAGNTYDFDIYFAERHTTGSNFRIQTGIQFDPNPIPEPSTVLFGSALCLVGLVRRNRRK